MSETTICNSGLRRISQPTILSFDDATQNVIAGHCKAMYPVERDFMLRAFPWNFATKRATLQRATETPDWGFAYKYPVPNDFLKLLKVDDEFDDHKLEGGAIVTDLETVKIKYTARITDTGLFDSDFSEMLAVRMSAVLAYPLTESNTLARAMWQLYEEYEMTAYSSDGQEGTPDAIEDLSLINIRI